MADQPQSLLFPPLGAISDITPDNPRTSYGSLETIFGNVRGSN